MPAACSPDAHLMNVLERPPPCGCTTSKCYGLMSGSVVSTTAQNHNMTNHHIVEQDSADCIIMQEALKAHLSDKSSGPRHGCPLRRQHPDHDQPITNDCRYKNEAAEEARV